MDWIVLGASAGLALVFSLLLWRKLLSQGLYALLLLSLLVFDFAWTSQQRIENLHLGAEQAMVQKITAVSKRLHEKDELLGEMAKLQAQLTVFSLSQKNPAAKLQDQEKKLEFRNQLLPRLAQQGIEPLVIEQLQHQLDDSIHSFLFASFSDELMQTLGRRSYVEFYKRYDRQTWTDQLFLREAKDLLLQTEQLQGLIAEKLMRVELYAEEKRLLPETQG